MPLDRLYLLYSLRLSGEATPEETKELEDLLNAHPEERLRLEVVKGLWASPAEETDVTRSYNRHLQRLSERQARPEAPVAFAPRRPRRILWLAAAASVALALAAGWWYERQSRPATPTPNAISTKRGSKSRVVLPDGTEVWLNGDSRLTYDAGTFGDNRNVRLDGEAYFDVASDPRHPFVIHTRAMDVRVLGTAFDVRSYADELTTQTSLFRGSVEVIVRDKHIVLKPNERITVANDRRAVTGDAARDAQQAARDAQLAAGDAPAAGVQLTVDKVRFDRDDSVALAAAWTKNKLAFDHETLEDIAKDIARWYDVTVTIKDNRLRQTNFTATFDDESLEAVLHALSLAGGNFHYTIRKREVLINP